MQDDGKNAARRRLKRRMGTLVSKMDEIQNIIETESLWEELYEVTSWSTFQQQAVQWVMERGGV